MEFGFWERGQLWAERLGMPVRSFGTHPQSDHPMTDKLARLSSKPGRLSWYDPSWICEPTVLDQRSGAGRLEVRLTMWRLLRGNVRKGVGICRGSGVGSFRVWGVLG